MEKEDSKHMGHLTHLLLRVNRTLQKPKSPLYPAHKIYYSYLYIRVHQFER